MEMDGPPPVGMPYQQQQLQQPQQQQQQQPPFLGGGDYPASGTAQPHAQPMQQGGGEQWTPCPVTVRLVRAAPTPQRAHGRATSLVPNSKDHLRVAWP